MARRPPAQRRFPAPWKVEVHDESMVVVDASGQRIAYLYFDEDSERRLSNQRHTKDEARRIASAIARLPELLTIEKRFKGEIVDEA